MFPLTRPLRQGLASLVLVALTVVPTLLIGAWAWRINRPGHLRDVEVELGRQLGLQVTLESVRYPRPGEIVYGGIVLRQEEPRSKGLTEIARADQLRMIRGEGELTLFADELKLHGESPRQAMAMMATLLQRSNGLRFERVNLAATACELDLGRHDLAYSFQELAGEFQAAANGPTLRLSYRLANPGAGTRCELTLARDRAAEPVKTTLALRTIDGLPLPARMLNLFFDVEEWLGPEARLEGALNLAQVGSKDWEADFRGNLIDIDLGTLVGRRFPRHHLAGRGRLSIAEARWGQRPGQGLGWLEARGELAASNGSIGVDLVRAMVREMAFLPAPRLDRMDSRKTEIEYRSLGLSFDMQPTGEIRLGGAVGGEFRADTVLASPAAALVFAPRGTATVHGLIKTLFPVADATPGVLVPLTAESQVLLALPVPPQVATKATKRVGAN